MTHHISATRSRRTQRLLATGLAVVVLALSGCGSGAGDDAESSAEPASAELATGGSVDAPAGDAKTQAGEAADVRVRARSVISTGMVSVYADEVAEARFDVQEVVDGVGGQIGDEQTDTGTEGAVIRSRLVVRVPAESFNETMTALEKIGNLTSSKRSSEDVTTQVIDVEVRIRAQEQSLRRIEVLLDRAESIKDIVDIEAQLTRRQADLDSLKQQQAWLADQTSESTITVLIEKTPKDGVPPVEDKSGFWAGLMAGWSNLTALASAVATMVGAVLPFAVTLLLLGVPLWWLFRRALPIRPGGTAEPTPTTEG